MESESDEQLSKFLEDIKMESVRKFLEEAKETFSSLRYMKPEHIKEAIPPLGLRMEFEEKFFVWKKNVLGIDNTASCSKKPNENPYNGKLILGKTLYSLLRETIRGINILEHQENYRDV